MPKEFTSEISKSELRQKLLIARKNIAERDALSDSIAKRVVPLLRGNVMVYASIGSEPSTFNMIKILLARDDVTVFAPYTADKRILPRRIVCVKTPDRYGNMPNECYSPSEFDDITNKVQIKLDYCVTPLVGFNGAGFRIGYGKGCYDRFFAQCDTYKIGLAFEALRVDFTPDINDVPLDCCVTEQKVIYF